MTEEPRHADGAVEPKASSDSAVVRMIILLFLGLGLGGFVAFRLLSTPAEPAPPEVARDPLLLRGRGIFLARCAACHGNNGKGDGQLASQLIGPPVGNLTAAKWKYGDDPDTVLKIIREGTQGSRMQGWGTVLDFADLNAVAAYAYYLGKRPVPDPLRKSIPN